MKKEMHYESPVIQGQEIELENVIADSQKTETADDQLATETWEEEELNTGIIDLY